MDDVLEVYQDNRKGTGMGCGKNPTLATQLYLGSAGMRC